MSLNMSRKFLLIIFTILLIIFTAHEISSKHMKNMETTLIHNNGEIKCNNLSLCHLIKKNFRTISSLNGFNSTAVQPRSYYNYGGNTSPAFYPAFDSLSILASLAFLAFLLQSFASLFDRSRSIIPTIVGSRNSPTELEPHDPMKLVMRALDEYEILSNDIILNNKKLQQKKLF